MNEALERIKSKNAALNRIRGRVEKETERRDLTGKAAPDKTAVIQPPPDPVVNFDRGVDATTRFFLSTTINDKQKEEVLQQHGYNPVRLPFSNELGFEEDGQLFAIDATGPDLGDVTEMVPPAIRAAGPIMGLLLGKPQSIMGAMGLAGLGGAAGESTNRGLASLGGAGSTPTAHFGEPTGEEAAQAMDDFMQFFPAGMEGPPIHRPGDSFEDTIEAMKSLRSTVDDIFVPVAITGLLDALGVGAFEVGAKMLRFFGAPGQRGFERAMRDPLQKEGMAVAEQMGVVDDIPAVAQSEGGMIDFATRRARQSVRGRELILEERKDRAQSSINNLFNKTVESLQPGNVPPEADAVVKGTIKSIGKAMQGPDATIPSQFEAGETLSGLVVKTIDKFRVVSGKMFNNIDKEAGNAPVSTQLLVDEIDDALKALDPRTDDTIISFLRHTRRRLRGKAEEETTPQNIAEFIAKRDRPAESFNPLTYHEVKNIMTDLGSRIDWRTVWKKGPDAMASKVYHRGREVLMDAAETFKPGMAPEIKAANSYFAKMQHLFESPITRAAKSKDAVPVYRQIFTTKENIIRAKEFAGSQFNTMKMGFTQDLFRLAPDESLINMPVNKVREHIALLKKQEIWEELFEAPERVVITDFLSLVEKTQSFFATRQGLLVDVLGKTKNLTTGQPFPQNIVDNIESFARAHNIDLNAPTKFNQQIGMAGERTSAEEALRDNITSEELKSLLRLRAFSRVIARGDKAIGEVPGDLVAPDEGTMIQLMIDLVLTKPASWVLTRPRLKTWLTKGLVSRQRGLAEKIGGPSTILGIEQARKKKNKRQPPLFESLLLLGLPTQ